MPSFVASGDESVHVLYIDEGAGEVWLLLRLGYGPTPPRSLRRPTSEVLI